ncbi:MAG: short-chain dehydrogenase/reductase [Pseudomonadota bacterium]
MDLGIQGKRALVTGGSKGIGLACARRLLQEGCEVTLVARDEMVLSTAADELRASTNGAVHYISADLSNSDTVADLCHAHGDLDILVNNAGAIPGGSLADVDEATWREAWDLKVFGYINMCRHIYEAMRGRGGVIINVIGAGGERPSAGYAAGAGGNGALMALTRAMGGISRKDNIRVVGVNPGQIVTERLESMQRRFAAKKFGDAERWQEMWDPNFPPGQPEHIGDMVAFLASDLSANTTGTVITIDGGHCAR